MLGLAEEVEGRNNGEGLKFEIEGREDDVECVDWLEKESFIGGIDGKNDGITLAMMLGVCGLCGLMEGNNEDEPGGEVDEI
mmetsp:Transcript_3010/g.4420  ORF Transcript_3010/g.4420 Transcript_3010/m.4420 type:complete len:81 (-) Transcript_3010:137-379(-)|eukprot:CAMPEP_0194302036 /NCGR_PEP_ID=MMETSP0169-20130528/62123_1 /TAXON_ID=218684 /ORGANISM="Corethron pennatum, Strain L29A3" /LENGTH=80 /DNA_ID=CAMNT_0039052337 /DNA_START=916 /DNA_END=1161 /DNA_ORIENTATION=+